MYNNLKQISLGFAVNLQCLEKNYTQELYTQENKEVFMNIFTGFIPPIHFMPPPVQKYYGPEKISRKHIYTEDKNFLVPLELQLRETYLQLNSYKKLYS